MLSCDESLVYDELIDDELLQFEQFSISILVSLSHSLSSLKIKAVKIIITQIIPAKYLSWGYKLPDTPNINSGAITKKRIIKNSLLR